ncbi:hypothetical protein VN97_g2881 [Penicillium thymicola]|uniref:Uncharacterized protein n=1 Tax=Penicillium thymicola TaxID=293382 RepID=A0AAI9TP20_PENTH|nr:hypothetical protein VN97_g2881 [Penicillium thymicola]
MAFVNLWSQIPFLASSKDQVPMCLCSKKLIERIFACERERKKRKTPDHILRTYIRYNVDRTHNNTTRLLERHQNAAETKSSYATTQAI